MVVVPRLAHREQTDVRDIVALDGMAADIPIARPGVVCEVTDEPVTEQRNGDADSEASKCAP